MLCLLCVKIGNTFRIPKRRFSVSGTGVQMESPLSRLPESSSLKVISHKPYPCSEKQDCLVFIHMS